MREGQELESGPGLRLAAAGETGQRVERGSPSDGAKGRPGAVQLLTAQCPRGETWQPLAYSYSVSTWERDRSRRRGKVGRRTS